MKRAPGIPPMSRPPRPPSSSRPDGAQNTGHALALARCGDATDHVEATAHVARRAARIRWTAPATPGANPLPGWQGLAGNSMGLNCRKVTDRSRRDPITVSQCKAWLNRKCGEPTVSVPAAPWGKHFEGADGLCICQRRLMVSRIRASSAFAPLPCGPSRGGISDLSRHSLTTVHLTLQES